MLQQRHESNIVLRAQYDQFSPPGAVFYLFSFTDGTRPCGVSFNGNYRSRIDMNAIKLWGIEEISDIFICFGILHLCRHIVPDVNVLMPPCLWPEQKNEQWCHLPKRTHVVPS